MAVKMHAMYLQQASSLILPRRPRQGARRLFRSAAVWVMMLAVALLPMCAASHSGRMGDWPMRLVAASMDVPDALAQEGNPVPSLQVSESWLTIDDVWNAGDRYARVSNTGPSGLRVRSGPGAEYPAKLILRESALVRVVGSFVDDRRVRWVEIAGDAGSNVAGWSDAEFLVPLPADWQPSQDAGSRPIVLGRIIPVMVTAYTFQVPGNGAHGWITKSGDLAAWGIVAVDPRIIPLGSELAIDGYPDLFLASDTGYGVLGNHVDIFFAEQRRAIEFGVQQRDVIVYEPQWSS